MANDAGGGAQSLAELPGSAGAAGNVIVDWAMPATSDAWAMVEPYSRAGPTSMQTQIADGRI